MLRVKLLGELTLEVDGEQMELPASRRARSLLGLLALERRTHPRGQLAARFWPDVLDESARTSLRSALSALRRALGADADRYLLATREAVALAGPGGGVDRRGRVRPAARGRAGSRMRSSCRGGDLLEDLDDDWVYERRDEHRARLVALLERMAAAAEAAGDLAAAIALTRRQVALDPLSEEAHRELIRRLAANGDRSAALTTYRRLADRFASELGIVPSPATRELVEQIRADETTRTPASPPLEGGSPPPTPAAASPQPAGASSPPRGRPRRRTRRRIHRARGGAERRTGTVTLLFTDQVGSTETLQRLGDEEGERLRRAHFALLREAAAMHGGEEVKNLGDGLMVAFVSAVDAIACAITIQQAVHRDRAERRAGVRGAHRPERRRADPRRGRLLRHAGGDRQAAVRRRRPGPDPRHRAGAGARRHPWRVFIPPARPLHAEGRRRAGRRLRGGVGAVLRAARAACRRCWPARTAARSSGAPRRRRCWRRHGAPCASVASAP